jgi:hypothetical protein
MVYAGNVGTNMFEALFSLLVLMALLGIAGEVTMRVRLSKRETPGEKLVWWRRGGDAVSIAYKESFPDSRIPAYRSFVFWFVVLCTASLLAVILLKSH